MKFLSFDDPFMPYMLVSADEPEAKINCPQVLAAIAVSLCSAIAGFNAGFTGTALESMIDEKEFSVSRDEASWVGSLMPLCALVGSLVGGFLLTFVGRRLTIHILALPLIVSYLLIALAQSILWVYLGRVVNGFCTGIITLCLPVYLGETLHPQVRGTLGLFPTLFGNGGILFAYTMGSFLKWRGLAYVGAAVPIPYFILMFFIPESPRWYVAHNKEEKAEKSLQWFRGKEADVGPELQELVSTQADSEADAKQYGLLSLLKWVNLKPLSISLSLMFFQQMSGINAVIYYAVSIFRGAGSTIEPTTCSIIIGVVNTLATLLATLVIDRVGRKMLLYVSSVVMTVMLLILSAYFWCQHDGLNVRSYGWVPLVCLVAYIMGFSFGFGPVPWLMMGEILPNKVRGPAASVATAFNWLFTFIITKTFLNLIELMGAHGTFLFYCAFCILAFIFTLIFVPETKGKSLEEIEELMTGRARELSFVSNFKPTPFFM